ncbi:Tenascin-N [Trichinella spiralis]|uniref:Tenascin-N n=1 Tax=Trichinella spiralis TaxID=6334 RepID=A0ABR3KY35_TRISP
MLLYGIISFLCTTTTILPYVVFAALENCRQHDNCIGLSLCMDGKCTAAIPTDITCEGQEYCYAHQVCRFGVCLESSVLPRSGCLSHADCEGQQLCVKGRCKVALPVGGFCLDNSQCGRMLTCKFNRCWQAVDSVHFDKNDMLKLHNPNWKKEFEPNYQKKPQQADVHHIDRTIGVLKQQ